MRLIPLVTGQNITAADMGFCTVHEHIVPGSVPSEKRQEAVDYSLKRLQKAYDLGVRTVIDVSPSVDFSLLKEVVEKTPMQVVACTGFYIDRDGTYTNRTVDDFLGHMLDEIHHGIQGSCIKPGVIKVATESSMPVGWEERVLTAAGIAQKESGLPICVHSVTGFQNQQRILEQAGADLSLVYFSHVEANQGWEGRSFEQQLHLMEEVLDKGSYFSFNNFGNWSHTPEECMVHLINALASDGYAGRMMATLDFVWSYQNDKPYVLWEDICEDGADRDYAYLITHVIPWMRKNGISEQLIHAMNYENPATLFA